MKERIIILMMVCGVAMFVIGGAGYKWVRRYLMPAVFFPMLMLLGVVWWQAAISCCVLAGVMTLGYE
jgi:p-aminobenzoyl-glutamate transporter AbgT